jgi:hypothetical protein
MLRPAAGKPRAIPPTIGVTLAVGLGCLLVAGLAAGAGGLVAAAVAVVLVVCFFAVGAWPLRLVRRDGSASPAALPLALGGYLVRVSGLAAIGLWLARHPGFDRAAFGATIVVCALAWPTAAAVAVLRKAPTTATERPKRRPGQAPGPD